MAAFLETDEDVAAYLSEAFKADDPSYAAHALGVVARARGMAKIARDTGLGRESLYKALSKTGNPELATVMKVAKALGIELAAAPAVPHTASKRPTRAKTGRRASSTSRAAE
jgi:probable addiction module antidote protein